MRPSILKDKSFSFAIRIVEFARDLQSQRKDYVLSRQILKSGTSIGALVHEAEYAQSRLDFISKMSIALKEANETNYWIDLLRAAQYLDEPFFSSLKTDCQELIKMLTASVKTAKENTLSKTK